MAERRKKTPSVSMAEQVHVLTMDLLNGNGRVAGFQMMRWIDEVATIVARRHAESDVTTARIDNLQLLVPAINKDTVIVRGKVVRVGRTSMDVAVRVYKERFSGSETMIAYADVMMVALDESETETLEVPLLVPETEEEERAMRDAEERAKTRWKI